MYLASSFAFMLQELALTMTVPSFQNFTLLVAGWVFASRRTVTGMLLAAGAAEERHHSAFHQLFSAARWSLDAVGLRVFSILEAALDEQAVLLAMTIRWPPNAACRCLEPACTMIRNSPVAAKRSLAGAITG